LLTGIEEYRTGNSLSDGKFNETALYHLPAPLLHCNL